MITRRGFITTAGAGLFTGSLLPRRGSAANERAGLSVWILRGGLDGLAAVPPWGDPDYADIRGSLGLPAPNTTGGILDLDGTFGLHPSLERMYQMYRARELLPIHAVASPIRSRSHFDAQKVLENGTESPAASSGWLNRLLGGRPLSNGLAISQSVPLILRGDSTNVTSWSPSTLPDPSAETLARIARLYESDGFFASRLADAMAARDLVAGTGMEDGGTRTRRGNDRVASAGAAAAFMREPGGPDLTVLEFGGWDTHANQGAAAGQLANPSCAARCGTWPLPRRPGTGLVPYRGNHRYRVRPNGVPERHRRYRPWHRDVDVRRRRGGRRRPGTG